MHDVENVVNDAAFWVALVVGGVGTVLVALRSRRGRREPGIAVVTVLACLIGLRVDHHLPAPLIVGLGLLVLGEVMFRDQAPLARHVAAVPGALVLAAALPEGWPFWIRVVVVLSAVGCGVLVDGAQRAEPRLVPPLLAISAVGLYFCVPDTDSLKALLGASIACAFVVFVASLEPTVGATAFTGLFVWLVGLGGIARAGSVVGGIACLGVVLLVPLLRRRANVVVLLVYQCALVAFVSRVAGFENSAWSALGLCALAFVIAAAALRVSPVRPSGS